jgi:hypothetical protein
VSDRSPNFEPGTSLVWNSSLRSLHSGLLLVGGADLAREFWLGHPLETTEGPLTGADLFEHIWREQALSPLEYQLRVLDSVEAFCLHHDMDFLDFLQNKLFGTQKGAFFSPRGALILVGRVLFHLVRSRDLHRTLLEVLDASTREIAPGLMTRLVQNSRKDDVGEGWVLQVHDRGFSGRFTGFDAEIWLGLQLKTSPRRLGGAHYEDVRCLCEVRDISHVLEAVPRGLHPVRMDDCWALDGRPITRATTFHEWVRRQGLDLEAFSDVPDHPVQEALEDIECPARRRRVVRQGAVYGSQCYLLRLRWRVGGGGSVEEGVAELIRDAMERDDASPIAQAARLHEDLLRMHRQKMSFVFHRQDDTMSCDGEHLLRGVPAKILQKVLMAHTLAGRTSFEHREFRRDPDLGLDPLNPNLESRIRILSDRLEDRLEGIRLVKSGRGRFELETKILLEFSEE